MKRKLPNLQVLLFLTALTACQKAESIKDAATASQKQVNTINTITGVNSCFDWQASPYINFKNGLAETLPWYSGAVAQIPNYILDDYKKEDGWELLYNMLSQSENGQNYVIFYNKFTGIVRTFYYLKADVTPGSNGMWALALSNNNAMLNNVGYFADPSNVTTQDPIVISSNLSTDQLTKGIAPGWNAFDTEFTYDPNAAQKVIKMRILSSTSNISQVSLTGDISLNSSGTITTIGSKNGAQNAANSVAKSAGDAAKSYITGKITGTSPVIKVASSVAGAIATGGVSEIVKAGINLLFGSFIGKKTEQTSSTQKLEFKSNGTISLTGTISSTSANNVASIANLYTPGTTADAGNFLLPCYNKKLGVWNLTSTPVVLTYKTVNYIGEGNHPDIGIYGRNYFIDPSSIHIAINPDVLSELESYEVQTDLLYYAKFKGSETWNGSSDGVMSYATLLYDDQANRFYTGNGLELISGPAPAPTDPTQDNPPSSIHSENVDKKFVVKVTVTLKPKAGYNQTPIVITRSYIPDYQFAD